MRDTKTKTQEKHNKNTIKTQRVVDRLTTMHVAKTKTQEKHKKNTIKTQYEPPGCARHKTNAIFLVPTVVRGRKNGLMPVKSKTQSHKILISGSGTHLEIPLVSVVCPPVSAGVRR